MPSPSTTNRYAPRAIRETPRRESRSLGVIPLLLGSLLFTGGCQEPPQTPAHLRVVDGDPQVGRDMIAAYACNVCHEIPDTPGMKGRVGPPLTGFGSRAYIGGHLPNRPDNLVKWLMDPPSVAPGTAMPDLDIPEVQARHIAAYLYTLR